MMSCRSSVHGPFELSLAGLVAFMLGGARAPATAQTIRAGRVIELTGSAS